jgi:transcriptional regulator with XRE-family HTH domain
MTFAEKLRDLRTGKGLSQKELADAANVTQAAVAHWEAGKKIPAFDSVLALCDALGVKCTAFDGCDFAADEGSRSRGRPKKAEPEEKPVKPAKKKKGGRP